MDRENEIDPAPTVNRSPVPCLWHILRGSEVPPALTVHIPKLEDIKPPKGCGQLPTQVVLLTVEDEEFLACYSYLKNVTKSFFPRLSWVFFGEMGDNETKVQVSLVRCMQGSSNPGAALTTTQSAIRTLWPKAVVCVGCCGALNLQKVKLGDVVLSAKLATYSNKKVTSLGDEVRATIPCVGSGMKNLILGAQHGWKAPHQNNAETPAWKVNLHCRGVIATGPELVAYRHRREELCRFFPEAIAIDMEGEGVYSACHDLGVEWVVIKGVSDYADGSESQTANWKLFASTMAASVVNHMFSDPEVLDHMLHYSDPRSSSNEDTTTASQDEQLIVNIPKELPVEEVGPSLPDTSSASQDEEDNVKFQKPVAANAFGTSVSGTSGASKDEEDTVTIQKKLAAETFTMSVSECKRSSCKIGELSPDTHRKICNFLDVEHSSFGDYRTLATKLGYNTTNLNAFKRGGRPTEEILKEWCTGKSHNVLKLMEILNEMNRHDVWEILQNEIKHHTCHCGKCPTIQWKNNDER